MTPPTTRTWSRRGTTPIIRVRGRSQHRISVAALACYVVTGAPDQAAGVRGLVRVSSARASSVREVTPSLV
jgi:hypothetical protein